MSTATYAELHARSAFSFLRGSANPEDLARAACAAGLPALALLDRDGVCGAPRLYASAEENNLRARVGAEITMEDGTVVPLLVTSQLGYQNLCQLITEAKLTERPVSPTPLLPLSPSSADHAPDPRDRKRPCFATWSELARFNEGLVALTGDEEGPVRHAWRTAGPAAAGVALDKLAAIFGHESDPDRARLFVEMQRHRLRGEEREVTFLRDLATARGLPLLATGGVNYAVPSQRMAADALTCIRLHTTLDAAGRALAANAERHVKSAAHMRRLFSDLPVALANTVRLEARLDFTLRNLGYRFPEFPSSLGHSMAQQLREQTYAGAVRRYGTISERVRSQIEKEIELITRLEFCGYFLIVWDICRYCRDHNILVQGRGSAANSVVCYALGITAVDPIKHELLFERFLSEGRVGRDGHPSWPDIDLDLPSGDLREQVIQRVYELYAPRGAAMTANVITYRGRSTVREIGKVLGFGDDALDRFSGLYANGDFPETLQLQQQLEMAGIAAHHPRAAAMVKLYQQIHGLPRHLGQHSGGMVICQGQLDRVVPLENASMPGRVVVQWDKEDCEDMGIVKVDFLGLGMMAVLQDTFKLCEQRGHPLELYSIPQDDAATYEAMQRADTIGVFQIESRAQMASLPRMRPKEFYDVAMQVAIVRPGPIVGNLAHPLIRRRNKLEEVDYIDPSVDDIVAPILRRTLGVILFQEQMLELAIKLAHYSGGEAEELRRSMGFVKNEGRLQRALDKLIVALRKADRNETVVKKVSESALSFAAYGFPESHALSFALLAYASTWLKVHKPAEFTASLLNNQPMGFYSPATILQDGRRHGLKSKPVCIQHSDWNCTVVSHDTIRIGLRYVKGLRESAARAMLAARAERPFSSLDDFLRRTHFNPAERRALAAVGALNVFAHHRRAALWQVEAAWSDDEALFKHYAEDVAAAEPIPGATATSPFDFHVIRENSPHPGASTGVTPRVAAPGAPGIDFHVLRENQTPVDSNFPIWGSPVEALAKPDFRLARRSLGERGSPVSLSPLPPMTLAERLRADFTGLELTSGAHPMALIRDQIPDVWRADELPLGKDGERVLVAGSVICRQRPGTAKGFVFISLEDETGIANVIVVPQLFEAQRLVITQEPALQITGKLQNLHGVIHVKAEKIVPLTAAALPAQASHDFH